MYCSKLLPEYFHLISQLCWVGAFIISILYMKEADTERLIIHKCIISIPATIVQFLHELTGQG